MFSKATEYALRATIYIAQKSSEENKVGIAEIAKAIDSPKSFTAKILQLLTKDNRIISSVTGPGGGFFITSSARKLPIRSVLSAMGEDDILEKCIIGLDKCSEKKPCPLHNKYKHIKAELKELFDGKSIQTLSEELTKGKRVLNN